MAAFEAFYADDVVAQENDEPERVGRDAWMRARQLMCRCASAHRGA